MRTNGECLCALVGTTARLWTICRVAGSIAALCWACGGTDSAPPRPHVNTGATGGRAAVSPLSTSCSPEGVTQECHRTVSQHDGIINCFYGTQTCVDGGWT